MSVVQRLMASGFAGCLLGSIGAIGSGLAAFFTAGFLDSFPDFFQGWDSGSDVARFVLKVAYVAICSLIGAAVGFLFGALANTLLTIKDQ
jgi:phage-related minor tail protein